MLPGSPQSRVWAEVDLSCVRSNVAAIRAIVGIRVEVMAVVKANGYGHGMVECAHAAISAGAASLGVATVAEGAAVRKAHTATPICLFTPISNDEVEVVIAS